MWLYIILAVVVILVCVAYYILRRGINRLKPDPVKDIPMPPLTHPLLGHPDKMLHPLKHELRLEVRNAARTPVHQLVVMKHSSVFINDSKEAGRMMGEMTSKGAIYAAFRFDPNVPDLLACDEEAWEVRRKALGPALSNMKMAKEENITKAFMKVLLKSSESGEPLDFMTLCTYLAMDCIAEAGFGYSLGAVEGSEEGKKLREALGIFSEVSAATGIYATPNARKVPAEEITAAKATWKGFMVKMLALIRSDSEQYRAKNGSLDVEHNLGHALIQLSVSEEAYGDAQLLSEIHQVFKHAHESLAGALCWVFVALHRNPKVRASLEAAVVKLPATSPKGGNTTVPPCEYLEHVILESMRRYPVLGNMTVRTVTSDDFKAGGFTIPPAIPVHIHMWSFHNNNHNWEKPKEFNPDRWNVPTTKAASQGVRKEGEVPTHAPTCPFLAHASRLKSEGLAGGEDMVRYSGLGYEEGGLDFFPFSAGNRSCPGKTLSLQVLRKIIVEVTKAYRLDAYDNYWDEECGSSVSAYNCTVVPVHKKSVMLKVKKMVNPGSIAEAAAIVKEQGWADDSDDEDKDLVKIVTKASSSATASSSSSSVSAAGSSAGLVLKSKGGDAGGSEVDK